MASTSAFEIGFAGSETADVLADGAEAPDAVAVAGDGAEVPVPSPLSRPPWPKSRLRLAEQTTMHNHRDPFRAPAREPKPGTFISPRMASGSSVSPKRRR